MAGNWQITAFTVFSTRKSLGSNIGWYNRWTRTLTFEHRAGLPVVGWAVGLSEPLAECAWELGGSQGEGELIAAAGASLPFSMGKTVKLKPGTSYELALYLAANREADVAVLPR